MVEITDDLLNKHIDNILDIIKSIQEGKITVIVGNNGVDLDWLQDWSHKLYLCINERSKKK